MSTGAENNKPIVSQENIGSLIIATVFIFVAVITLYDTTHYSDIDSKVFPRACAIVLLIFSVVTVIGELIKPSKIEGFRFTVDRHMSCL